MARQTSNPLVVLESVQDLRDAVDLFEKESISQHRRERDRFKFLRVRAVLAELEAGAEERLRKDAEPKPERAPRAPRGETNA